MKKDISVAVASRSFSNHPVLRKELLDRYPCVTFNDEGKSLSGQDLIDFLKGHEKVITALEVLNESVFSALPDLKVVGKYGVGLDMIDLDAMARHNVLLGWTGGVNKRSVSELVVSSAISLLHRIPFANSEVKSGKWYQIKGQQLTGRTVGIIGCGHIGKDLVGLLKNFDCKILSYDILDFPEFYARNQIISTNLEDLLQRSEIITLHLPYDESTHYILDARHLEMIRPGAILMNLARGKLIDEKKLKNMLKSGQIGGLAIDVFGHEPPEDMELINLPNVLATPHIAGSTEEAILEMGRAAILGLDSPKSPLSFKTIKITKNQTGSV